jgi:hypothetical protein
MGPFETGVQTKVITKQKLFSIYGTKDIEGEPKQIERENKELH